MRPDRVVVDAPLLDEHLCFSQRVEDFSVEQFIAQEPQADTQPECNNGGFTFNHVQRVNSRWEFEATALRECNPTDLNAAGRDNATPLVRAMHAGAATEFGPDPRPGLLPEASARATNDAARKRPRCTPLFASSWRPSSRGPENAIARCPASSNGSSARISNAGFSPTVP